MYTEQLDVVEVELSWVHLKPEEFRREQWCADGDGFFVVKACSTGFLALDQNLRKRVGKYPSSHAAIVALEGYMKTNEPETFEYLREKWPGGPLEEKSLGIVAPWWGAQIPW